MALAELEDGLPPILVHGATLRVIDGMHRLRAARLRGQDSIEVQFFHGSEELSFVLAVKANVAHGLPLSLADREAAAARILTGGQHWSDRAVAAIAGLSPRTVAAIRGRVAHESHPPQGAHGSQGSKARLGQDGRLRPLDIAAGRRRASEALAASPEASLREIARTAGVSPNTVRDVRDRMRRGDDPLPPRIRAGRAGRSQQSAPDRGHAQTGDQGPASAQAQQAQVARAAAAKDPLEILPNLRRDPSIRLNHIGRELLRWLDAQARGSTAWERFAETVPAHCTDTVAELATACANEWLEFARHLERRSREMNRPLDA